MSPSRCWGYVLFLLRDAITIKRQEERQFGTSLRRGNTPIDELIFGGKKGASVHKIVLGTGAAKHWCARSTDWKFLVESTSRCFILSICHHHMPPRQKQLFVCACSGETSCIPYFRRYRANERPYYIAQYNEVVFGCFWWGFSWSRGTALRRKRILAVKGFISLSHDAPAHQTRIHTICSCVFFAWQMCIDRY